MKASLAPIFRNMVRLNVFIEARRPGRIVLANGCFDPLHVGHTRYLSGAREHGDFLVVALNDDRSTRALKGKNRPTVPVLDRAKIIAALFHVDAVLVFSASDVSRILKKIRPQVHAKGTDYTVETVPELSVSHGLGIKTVIVGDPKAHASSELVERIRRSKKTHGVNSG